MKKGEAQTMGVFKGSGNVFADLGIPNADEELAKAEMACELRHWIETTNIGPEEAANILGTETAKITALMGGRVSGFTHDQLLRFLNALEA